MKIIITESQLKYLYNLTESGGITSKSRVWTPIVMKFLDTEEDKIIILGKDYPEQYKDFPIDKMVVTLNGIPHYDEQKSGYDKKTGLYTVYITINSSVSFIQHEFKHAYQDLMRYLNKSKPFKESNFIKDLYTPDFEKFVINVFGGSDNTLELILYYYYITSKVEQDAYLENMYDDSETLNSFIKDLNEINNFDFNKNLSEKKWNEIKSSNIPFIKKFKSKEDFASYSEKRIKGEINNFKKKIYKMKVVHNLK
jgi:hypothetical protein